MAEKKVLHKRGGQIAFTDFLKNKEKGLHKTLCSDMVLANSSFAVTDEQVTCKLCLQKMKKSKQE